MNHLLAVSTGHFDDIRAEKISLLITTMVTGDVKFLLSFEEGEDVC